MNFTLMWVGNHHSVLNISAINFPFLSIIPELCSLCRATNYSRNYARILATSLVGGFNLMASVGHAAIESYY